MTDRGSTTSAQRAARDGANPTPRDLVPYLLNRAANGVNGAWRDRLRPYGLTVQRWQVLSVLMAFDGAAVTELAELVAIDQPVMSRVVGQMERDGLVERRSDSDDGRVSRVHLTERGRSTHHELLPQATAFVDRLTQGLSDDQIAEISALLVRLAEAAEQPTDDGERA